MFEILADGGSHFVAHNGKGEFKIAKKALPKTKVAEFQRLCRGGSVRMAEGGQVPRMADGGEMIGPPAPDAWDPAALAAFEGPAPGPASAPVIARPDYGDVPQWIKDRAPELAAWEEREAMANARPPLPNGGAQAAIGRLIGGSYGRGLEAAAMAPPGMPSPAPTGPMAGPGAPPATGVAPPLPANVQGAGVASVNPMGGYLGQLQGAERMGERGLAAEAKAQGEMSRAQATALEEDATQRALQQKYFQDHLQALNVEHDRIADDVANYHIDPNRLWSSRSEGQKASVMIGMILGGLGAGMAGGQNHAIELLNRSIDRDIDAQKVELGKKENLLADNVRQYGNLFAAEQVTRLQLAAGLEGQLKLAAARSGDAMAQARAQQGISQLRMNLIPHLMQAAQFQMMYSMTQQAGQGEGMLPSMASPPVGKDMMDFTGAIRDKSERSVIGPGGRQFLAYDKETATKAREKLAAQDELESTVNAMDDLRRKASAGLLPGTQASNLYQKYKANLEFQYMNAHGLKRLSAEDAKMIESAAPDRLDTFLRGVTSFEPIRRSIYMNRTSTWRHAGLHPKVIPPFEEPIR